MVAAASSGSVVGGTESRYTRRSTARPTSSTSIITATPMPTLISATRCAGAVPTARAARTSAVTGSQTPSTLSSRMASCALSSLSVRSSGTVRSTVGMCAAFS